MFLKKSIVITCFSLLAYAGFLFPTFSSAQIANPADKQKPDTVASVQTAEVDTPSYEIVVYGKKNGMREEDRIGAYSQPRWTATRRFLETRVYVMPKGEFGFEYWLIPQVSKDNSTEITQQYEFEMGLPLRFQLDLYVVSHQQGNEGEIQFDEQKFEVRWAMANWGVIPCNPTLYLEWAANSNAPSHLEGKLLLGGEFISRLHWGLNLVYEYETAGENEICREITGGLSYTLKDNLASIGAEVKSAFIDVKSDRGHYEKELTIGPSFQLHPLPRATIDLVSLFGLTDDSPEVKPMLIVGWDF